MKVLLALVVAGSALVWAPSHTQKGTPPPAGSSQRQQPPEPVFQKVFPKPTGQNGYEEFLRAADLTQVDVFRRFADYYARLEQEAAGADLHGDDGKLLPRPPLPPNVRPEDTLLEVGRKWSAAFSAIPELIHVGCQKSPHDPRNDFNAGTLFPELPRFRGLSRFLGVVARVHSADGAPAKATTVLSDGLRLGDGIAGPTILHTLVGFAVQGQMLAHASESLSLFSERDCQTLKGLADETLSKPSPAVRSVTGERTFLTNSISEAFRPGQANPLEGLLGESDVPAFAKKLGPNAILELKAKLIGRLNRAYAKVESALRRPDSEWFKDESLEHAVQDVPERDEVKNLDDLADYLEGTLLPAFDGVQVLAARYRTQLRLLKLHTEILQFKWHWKRLPIRLAEAAPTDQLVDPFSGQEFQYSPTGTGYRLFSRGFKDTGEIELKYTRPVSAGGNPADPPGFSTGSFEPGVLGLFLRNEKKFTELAIFPLN